jgi:hypothetical protein
MFRTSLAAVACCALLAAQDRRGSFKFDFEKDSPVGVVAADWGESTLTPRGGAIVVDLHSALTLRNLSQRRIRGVTLMVTAQEVTPGGRASVAVPSLDIAPGDTFPVRIDLRLLKPAAQGGGALVEVSLDGVLFDDLQFFGPNRLQSRRTMTVWELEARRDRHHFRKVLETAGREALQQEILGALQRQTDRQQFGVQVVRGPATNQAPEPARAVQFAFLRFPDAPVEAAGSPVELVGMEARAPRLSVHNHAGRAVKHLEIGWLVEDENGREFFAGAVPAAVNLAAGQKAQVAGEGGLRFPRAQSIRSMRGFLASVEFADQSVWVPSRGSLAAVRDALPPSPEEQRLVQIYRKKGLAALVEELKRF